MSLESFSFCPRCGKPLAERSIVDIDGVASRRRACEQACGFVQWRNPVPVVGALVEHEGDIILAREVKEELGLEVVESNLIGNYIFDRKNEVVMCYHALATGTVRLGAERPALRPEPGRT